MTNISAVPSASETHVQNQLPFGVAGEAPDGLARSRREWAAKKETSDAAELAELRALAGPRMSRFVGTFVVVRVSFLRQELRGILRVTGPGSFEITGQPFLETDLLTPPLLAGLNPPGAGGSKMGLSTMSVAA